MTNEEVKALALSLLKVDSEQEVITILKKAGYWERDEVWRLYGDKETNYATIGNQQSRPEAALVEKIVNSVDARLLNECLIHGIDATSSKAPQSIREAVARFFEGREVKGDVGGQLADWPSDRVLSESHRITLAVTGPTARVGSPSLTIADCGEGQTPRRMPDTFLSLTEKSNKLRIPFVQGKFNMGGTGVLKFCGDQSLELIITRRNPVIVEKQHEEEKDPTANDWGVTIVRRERPKAGAGQVRNSVFRYLAPLGAEKNPGHGEVLCFSAPNLPIMPEDNKAYARAVPFGSVLKLYEYDMKGFKSHALMKGGLLSRLEILLPEIALPVRVHECRQYRGDEARSFTNSLVGLAIRLAENRAENLEPGYPTSVPLMVRGASMVANIYAFKGDKAESYRTTEGIIFTVNGQTHGAIQKSFFDRSRVKMNRLAKSLLLTVDCSRLSVGDREDLFMNSRDRLLKGELHKAIEDELEDVVGKHPGLRELRERRRQEEVENRLRESKPLEEVLDSILKGSPTLSRLFLTGQRLSRPFRGGAGSGEGGGPDAKGDGRQAFVGKKHPSFFRFAGRAAGEDLSRSCEIGRRARIKFETDVENGYFGRPALPGRNHIEVLEGVLEGDQLGNNMALHDGVATWSISLPEDSLQPGETLTVQCTVTDDTLVEPLVNVVRLRAVRMTEREGGNGERKPRRIGAGENASGKGEEKSGLALPDIVHVKEGDDNWLKHKFDDLTACKVIEDAAGPEDDEHSIFTFYVNVDNRYLGTEIKNGGADPQVTQAKFVYGNVLIGLALIHDRKNRNEKNGDADGGEEVSVTAAVEETTRALAPFLVPMIDYLGAISPEEISSLAHAGDED